jgi:hypothetical protein
MTATYMNLMESRRRHVPHFAKVAPEGLTIAEIIERGKKARAGLGIRANYNIVQVDIASRLVQQDVAAAVAPDEQQAPMVIVVTQEKIDQAEDDSPIIHMPSWKRIVREVSKKHGVAIVDILSTRRSQPFVNARYEAMYRMRHETNMSFPQIGRRLGGRDHTTVLHGVREHAKRVGGQP